MDNLDYIEAMRSAWEKDPSGVEDAWAEFFSSAGAAATSGMGVEPPGSGPGEPDQKIGQGRVDSLLWAYRDVGYLYARVNPLGDFTPDHSYLPHAVEGEYEKLTLEEFGIPPADLDRLFSAGPAMKPPTAPLRSIIEAFRSTYCSSIGAEFLHIQNKKIRRWLIDKMESVRNRAELSREERRGIMADLIRTEEMERFLQSFFVGQKRFSLEGAEALIPALHFLVNRAAAGGMDTVSIGTTHRGRLSVLATILNMPPEEIFSRFDENYDTGMYHGAGDVKYHIGYTTVHVNEDGSSVNVDLSANPSHLESIDSVVEGKSRAYQDGLREAGRARVLPVIIHGDAAFSGQGVVAETLNLSGLPGFSTGGTIHIIINNQIGFTTPSRSARSTFYPTDVAKMLPVPVFHVNGDHPESIVYLMELALEFRAQFGLDCIVDIFCYRRHGHNEGDEPSYTHPHMYRVIQDHPGVTAIHGEFCDRNEIMGREEQGKIREEHRITLKAALDRARSRPVRAGIESQGPLWDAVTFKYSWEKAATGVPEDRLREIAARISAVPEDFSINPKLRRIVEGKLQVLTDKNLVDWAFAESLAFGSLLVEGVPVRLTGQDSDRGTFSQRHLTWWDTQSPAPRHHTPLAALSGPKAPFMAFDSPLSEYSVLGFEYGYSLVNPQTLVMWEAQFGDFANGAQVVLDNFIATGESKWQHRSGLVLLLPHGSEGQGPDHSSAHLDRLLQAAAEENIQICNATTPAQYFHLLRRQVTVPFRKPLFILTPKSLLRHPLVVSPVSDLSRGAFEPVIDDPAAAAGVKRVLLCSGKVYYDLRDHREKNRRFDVAIVRVEQLYPFPAAQLGAIAARFAGADVYWVQEEHRNFGAWGFMVEQLRAALPHVNPVYAGRPESASPATGLLKVHRVEQQKVVESAFAGT
jgi:2-oxoglutarate dehydrogenase E1 component